MAALLEAGREFGLVREDREPSDDRARRRLDPSPVPAIYSGETMKPFREWLSARSWEPTRRSGSFVSDDIEDYTAPRGTSGTARDQVRSRVHRAEALAQMVDKPHRRKVWLKWHDEERR